MLMMQTAARLSSCFPPPRPPILDSKVLATHGDKDQICEERRKTPEAMNCDAKTYSIRGLDMPEASRQDPAMKTTRPGSASPRTFRIVFTSETVRLLHFPSHS